MPWKKKLQLYHDGIIDFPTLSSNRTLNANQHTQIQSTLSGEDIIDREGIRLFLHENIRFPLYHLDFETIQPVVPEYQGTHPYQQIPTQYSLHIEKTQGGETVHYEFLADAFSKTPMRDVAEQLCKDIPADVCVLVYNDTFEKSRIKEMADAFPDLREHLISIRENIVDLLVPFRQWCYYRPDMQGSFSIKKVLPALFPNDPTLDYHNLAGSVHNGGEAMDVFPKMRTMSEDDVATTRESLLRYCELDTWSMVVILRRLYELAES